ncbi:hypothetical protein [Parabacteroides sp. PF5-6]|uniref:hypothetical protein n=1 Tax=Parabacteroides sp. PF5-6 TaxID=1742403 RepID=UPI0024070C06|nr:hypothetical protein [Parabacteroides sp. PF5-6]MDF9829404.1 hypothetical protein [Parabacteroides sp. PF5-6]
MTTVELALKQSLIRKLIQTDDQKVLEKIQHLLNRTASEEKEDVLYFSKELKERINLAEQQLQNGELIDQEDLDVEVEKWLAE